MWFTGELECELVFVNWNVLRVSCAASVSVYYLLLNNVVLWICFVDLLWICYLLLDSKERVQRLAILLLRSHQYNYHRYNIIVGKDNKS